MKIVIPLFGLLIMANPVFAQATSTPEMTRDEFSFFYCIIIFALFIPIWDILFRPVRRLYDKKQGV